MRPISAKDLVGDLRKARGFVVNSRTRPRQKPSVTCSSQSCRSMRRIGILGRAYHLPRGTAFPHRGHVMQVLSAPSNCFSNPLSNQRAGYVCNASHGLFAPCLDEQIFGADEQVSGRRRRHLRSIRLNANAERKGPNSTSSRSANLPRPSTRLGLFRPWQRRTDLWRERTNLRTGSERLRGVGPPVVVAPPPTDDSEFPACSHMGGTGER